MKWLLYILLPSIVWAQSTQKTRYLKVDTIGSYDKHRIQLTDSLFLSSGIYVNGLSVIDSTVWAKLWRLGLYTPLTDSRLSDARTPLAHNQAQSTITNLTDSISAKPTRTELTTLLGTKQGAISNLSDTSKYIEYGDTLATNKIATKEQTRIGYIGKSDSSTMPGYITRTQLVSDTAYRSAQMSLRVLYSDTAGGKQVASWEYVRLHPGPATVDSAVWAKLWLLNNRTDTSTGGKYTTKEQERINLGTKQNTISNLADTAKYVENLDSLLSGTGYARNWQILTKVGVMGYSTGDTSAFVTTATRLAIFVSGARDSQIWQATSRIPANTTLPVAGDQLSCSSKWDSVIVKRAAGTTSGLKINYFRVK